MATTIKLKNGTGAPSAGALVVAEPALDLTNKRLYTEDSGGTVIEVGTNPGEDVTFADNRKAIFGAGSDLQIYHDGDSSYISHNTTGTDFVIEATSPGDDVIVRAADDLNFRVNGNENGIVVVGGGATTLYNNNSAKLATTSTGIDVTGTVTADGLTVDANNATAGTFSRNGAIEVEIESLNSASDANLGLKSTTNTWRLQNLATSRDFAISDDLVKRMSISNATGDISFYEDTGTTAKLFWDASAERLGIGTSSPDRLLHLNTGTTGAITPLLRLEGQFTSNTGNEGTAIEFITGSGGTEVGARIIATREAAGARGALRFCTGRENDAGFDDGNVVIDESGNVGIGTSSPQRQLHVNGSTGALRLQGTSVGGYVEFVSPTSTSYIGHPASISSGSTDDFGFYVAGTERMRIDSSGNLLVGATEYPDDTINNTTGFGVASTGETIAAVNGGRAAVFKRMTSDGSIVEFFKDSNSVGSIGTEGGDLVIGTGTNCGLQFNDGNTAIRPFNIAGNAPLDNAIDLGVSGTRFKDLYLSGTATCENVVVGTNGQITASNALYKNANYHVFRSASESEYARFDNSGNLLVGGTTTNAAGSFTIRPNNSNGSCLVQINRADTTATSNAFVFYNNGSGVGSITYNNASTAYNTSSDQRLKENIVDAPSASDDIDAIQVRSFDWKVNGSHQKYGMVAQELQSVAPEAVSGDADSDEMMGVDYSKLVPMLVKEIQSLRARVAQLEGAN